VSNPLSGGEVRRFVSKKNAGMVQRRVTSSVNDVGLLPRYSDRLFLPVRIPSLYSGCKSAEIQENTENRLKAMRFLALRD